MLKKIVITEWNISIVKYVLFGTKLFKLEY